MSSLTIELPSQEEQTVFNLERWSALLLDEELARWQGRVETDRQGHVLLNPPESSDHGGCQADVCCLLKELLPSGRVSGACPISTRDGVKIADAAWISGEKLARIGRKVCLTEAPEVCVEILSPSNTKREMAEKMAFYFAAGAEEVWFCDRTGRMTFFIGPESTGEAASGICPAFPAVVWS